LAALRSELQMERNRSSGFERKYVDHKKRSEEKQAKQEVVYKVGMTVYMYVYMYVYIYVYMYISISVSMCSTALY
jgi:hypothetical protein